ncbi:type VI secretion system contractile sheath domain-containing protein [Siccirubricoccus deserti]
MQAAPEAAYIGLAAPRFLLRMPYGKKSDPIDSFAFEESPARAGSAACSGPTPPCWPGCCWPRAMPAAAPS